MKTFNDNSGRTWTVSINIASMKRVRSLCEIDLMEAVGGKLLEKLVADPVLLCDVLFALCKGEADAKEISDEEFGQALAGDVIDAATTALLEELVDFFPQGKRRVLGKALAKLKKLQARVLEASETLIDSPALEERMEKAIGELGSSFGNSPALSESTRET